MPAGGFKTFVAGEILESAEVNDFLMQGILVFADATARDAAITSPVEGQFVFRTDEDVLEFFDGTEFVPQVSEPPDEPAATGGTVVVDAPHTYHSFTSNGTLTVTSAGTFEIIAIAGGGAGSLFFSGAGGGGGGAGGGLFSKEFLEVGTYSVVVGAGGSNAASIGTDGANTTIASVTAVGGGRGSAGSATPGNGGSGGGGSRDQATGGTGIAFQGNPGGTNSGAFTGGAGGGGRGGNGGNAAGRSGVGGGSGTNFFHAWGDALTLGVLSAGLRYFAGGGGGGGEAFNAGGGGLGGGGAGGLEAGAATSGLANTGGGGGGSASGTNGAGGSGVVMLRYLT